MEWILLKIVVTPHDAATAAGRAAGARGGVAGAEGGYFAALRAKPRHVDADPNLGSLRMLECWGFPGA